MAAIDVTDSALIHAEPGVVFDEILRMMRGETRWWLPHLVVRSVEQTKEVVGSRSEIIVPRRVRFVARIESLTAPSALAVEYVGGDFRGTGLWSFEPVPGGTRVSFRWRPAPTRRLLRFLAPIVRRNHSRVMQLGFCALDAHLKRSLPGADKGVE